MKWSQKLPHLGVEFLDLKRKASKSKIQLVGPNPRNISLMIFTNIFGI
jgi:hypothetical protein